MVTNRKEHSEKTPAKQGPQEASPEPNKIGASTPYDFAGKNMTPYGGLLPVITMLEKLGVPALAEQTLTSARIPRAMDLYRFVLGIVLGLYIGFPRLNQLRFVARDPILTGILIVSRLPVQSTFLTLMRILRARVWEAADVKLEIVTLDTDTTVHTLYGQQMGGRKSYNPKNKGKKSYQPMLTFLAETREYLWGELGNGDRPTGQQIGAGSVSAADGSAASDCAAWARLRPGDAAGLGLLCIENYARTASATKQETSTRGLARWTAGREMRQQRTN